MFVLEINRFRCLDLGKAQYGIQVCTFEDIIIDDVIIKGDKDGVHLGRGKRFTLRNGVFQTFDDAVALNAHDYLRTKINLLGCVFNQDGAMDLVTNSVAGKEVVLRTSSNLAVHDTFVARVIPGPGHITIDSDLPGLRR